MPDPDVLNPELSPDAAAPKGALAIIFLIVFTDLVGFGIIIPALPFYIPDYQRHPLKVTMLFGIYSVCQFIASPILGRLSDKIGRKPVLAFSQLGSAVGYFLLAYATHFTGTPWLLRLVFISRIIDGLSGGNISTAQAYISDVTTPKNRAKGMGLLGAAFGIGFSVGPAIGGILGKYNLAWPGYAACVFSAVAALLTFARLPESRIHKPADVDAWLHPRVFAPVFKRPVLVQLLLISFITMAAFVMMETTIGLYTNRLYGWDQYKLGKYFAYIGLIIIIVQGGLIGRLTKKLGEWPLAIAGPLLVAAGMAGYVSLASHPIFAVLLIAGAVNATGRSFQGPTLSSLVSQFSDPKEQGVVFGLVQGLSSLARVLGPLLAGFLYPMLNNTAPYLAAGIFTAAAAVWMVIVRKQAAREKPEQPPGGFEVVMPASESIQG